MKFEVSERIRTSKSQDEVLNSLESQFKKVARGTSRKGQVLAAVSIEASFGSINRKDTTVVEVERAEDGWLLVAKVDYRPSVAFWIIFCITLFSWVLWIVPVGFYLFQKNTVRSAIADCMQRVKNEHEQLVHVAPSIAAPSIAAPSTAAPSTADPSISVTSLDALERLGSLRDKGLISDDEFAAKKKQILGL